MQDRIIFTKCPLCESPNIAAHRMADCSKHPLFDARLQSIMAWKKCADCAHVFTEGYYTEEAQRIVFAKTNDTQKVGHNIEQNRNVSARMVEKVLPYAQKGIWLDIGIGNGSLLFTAQEYGFKPIGTDLRAENVARLAAFGIEAHQREIADLILPEACSVISMADVLEHMPYPKEGLRAAHRLLKKGGVLFVSMPNSETALWDILTQNNLNPYWQEMEHYHNFSRSRFYALLEEFGFTPRRYGVSERYRICMEIIAEKTSDL